jgi:hypothetical protein
MANLKLSDLCASDMANAAGLLRSGGFIDIYDGAQPANANTAIVSQVLLVTLTFGTPGFGAAAYGVSVADPIASGVAIANGTASWYRTYKIDHTTAVTDGSVGTTGSGSNLELNTTTIGVGNVVACVSWTFTVPEA